MQPNCNMHLCSIGHPLTLQSVSVFLLAVCHWLQVFWRILSQVCFHVYKWELILLFSLVMSPDSVGQFVLFPCPDVPFSSSQARVICESPLCAAHIPYRLLNKDTKSRCFWHQQCFFLLDDSVALPSAFSLPYASFAFQFRFSFLLGPRCCPLYLFFILPIMVFSDDFFFFVGFHVFWVYLQLYFSKIGLEAIFWITESRSLLFQTAVPWNPLKILIELQFDETVKSIKFSAPAFSTGRPFSSYPAWMVKILLQISSLNLLTASFYHLSRCQCSPWASLGPFTLYCFPLPSFSIFMDGNQIPSQNLLSELTHAKLFHKLADKGQCKNSWISF